jgi:ribonuclease P/MRP protein subunit RPP40
LLYANDVTSLFDADVVCKLYADDVKLYSVVQTSNDAERLQFNVDRLVDWSKKWQLTISSTKSVILNIGHNESRQMCNIDGKSGQSVYEMRDLGVVIDSELSMAPHINYTAGKSARRAHLISKCFLSRDRNTLVHAFLTYVRPILEYASLVWSPYTRADI